MAKILEDKSFDNEHSAREHAISISASQAMHIILTADQYFVSASKNIQPYEKLIASYLHGEQFVCQASKAYKQSNQIADAD